MNTRKFLTILAGLPVLGLAGLDMKEQKYTVEMEIFNVKSRKLCHVGIISNVLHSVDGKTLVLTLSSTDKISLMSNPPVLNISPHYFSELELVKLVDIYKDSIKKGLYRFNITAV